MIFVKILKDSCIFISATSFSFDCGKGAESVAKQSRLDHNLVCALDKTYTLQHLSFIILVYPNRKCPIQYASESQSRFGTRSYNVRPHLQFCRSKKMDPSHLIYSITFFSSMNGALLSKCTAIKRRQRSSDSDWCAEFGLNSWKGRSMSLQLQITRATTIHQSEWRGRLYGSVFPQ
jgi:hypothetical protein